MLTIFLLCGSAFAERVQQALIHDAIGSALAATAGMEHFPPLCDAAIVQETCGALKRSNLGEGQIFVGAVGYALSATRKSTVAFLRGIG